MNRASAQAAFYKSALQRSDIAKQFDAFHKKILQKMFDQNCRAGDPKFQGAQSPHGVTKDMNSEVWDISRAARSVGGDSEFLSELAGIFSAACPTLLKNLEEAIQSRNFLRAVDSAHLIWSAARTLSATEVMNAARAVETMARSNEMNGIENAYRSLDREAGRLLNALAEFRSLRLAPPGQPEPDKR
jgi:HPt (histidine-containing phosphotransfer) domain-containing protein